MVKLEGCRADVCTFLNITFACLDTGVHRVTVVKSETLLLYIFYTAS